MTLLVVLLSLVSVITASPTLGLDSSNASGGRDTKTSIEPFIITSSAAASTIFKTDTGNNQRLLLRKKVDSSQDIEQGIEEHKQRQQITSASATKSRRTDTDNAAVVSEKEFVHSLLVEDDYEFLQRYLEFDINSFISIVPTFVPTKIPTKVPTPQTVTTTAPVVQVLPTQAPITKAPTIKPTTAVPISVPTTAAPITPVPTTTNTAVPTLSPVLAPITPAPVLVGTVPPTSLPTTTRPTTIPPSSALPSDFPSFAPTVIVTTASPTPDDDEPVVSPAPTSSPLITTSLPTTSIPIVTSSPTGTPTSAPTGSPIVTDAPTSTPILTDVPTGTQILTDVPTGTPIATDVPTGTPIATDVPTNSPIATSTPTASPSVAPVTGAPTAIPTGTPTLAPTSAPTAEPVTLLELIRATPSLSTLETAITLADTNKRGTIPFLVDILAQESPLLTAFAPTDTAFSLIETQSWYQNYLTEPYGFHLFQLLAFHVATPVFRSSNFPITSVPNLAQGFLSIREKNTTINGTSFYVNASLPSSVPIGSTVSPSDRIPDIIVPDINATNGVAHLIDAVLIPPFVNQTIFDALVSLGSDFSTFANLVQVSGIDVALANVSNVTLLVPPNDVISIITEEYLLRPGNEEILFQVIQYHFLDQVFNYAAQQIPFLGLKKTLQSENIITGVVVSERVNGTLAVNFNVAKLSTSNSPNIFFARDSLGYVIDTFLVPPSLSSIVPRSAVTEPSSGGFVDFVASGLLSENDYDTYIAATAAGVTESESDEVVGIRKQRRNQQEQRSRYHQTDNTHTSSLLHIEQEQQIQRQPSLQMESHI